MPELPEVEVISRFLSAKVTDKKIANIQVNRKDLRVPITENIADIAKDKKILRIWRRGKYIILSLSNSDNIVIHLGMSGRLMYYQNHNLYQLSKHDHVIFFLDDYSSIVFNDPRRFGLILSLIDNQCIKFFEKLAPEPLLDSFNADYLQKSLINKNVNIKSCLINNQTVVGVGNIYASESLFRSGILPTRIAKTLTFIECSKLVVAIKVVLTDAISAGGSTLKDYTKPTGSKGEFQNYFAVYNKEGQLCICNNTIIKIKQSGRSTFYCGYCQQ